MALVCIFFMIFNFKRKMRNRIKEQEVGFSQIIDSVIGRGQKGKRLAYGYIYFEAARRPARNVLRQASWTSAYLCGPTVMILRAMS